MTNPEQIDLTPNEPENVNFEQSKIVRLLPQDRLKRWLIRNFDFIRDILTNSPVRNSVQIYRSPVPANGSSTLILEHNLGREPRFITVELICVTAEGGHEVGDIATISPNRIGANSGVVVTKNGAGLANGVRYAIGSSGITILNEDNGNDFTITNANWDLRIRLYG